MQVVTGTLKQLATAATRRQVGRLCRAALSTQALRHRTVASHTAAAKRWNKVSIGQARRHFRSSAVALGYPAHKVINMPALSPTMTAGNMASWAKKEGEEVAAGDVLAEIETDKATMEFEGADDGFLAKILVPAGTKDVTVGQPLCVIVEEKDAVAAFADYKPDSAAAPAPAKAETPAPAPPAPAAAPPPPAPAASAPPKAAAAPAPTVASGGGRGSPLAKRLARELGFDISKIPGSGPDGRVVEVDVYAFAKTAMAAPAATAGAPAAAPAVMSDAQAAQAHTALAARLVEAKQTVPHYYLTTEVNLDPIYKLNEELSEGKDDKVGAAAFLLKATALASLAVPACNSSWMGTAIRQYSSVDIALAVTTPAGTITPVISAAEAKGLKSLAASAKSLTEQAKSGSVSASQQGGTITVSTLGLERSALLSAAAIVMPPQACSLSVGSPTKRLVPGPGGKPTVATIAQMTLSCDHRVVDGAVGAEWLKVFKSLCEKPTRMLL